MFTKSGMREMHAAMHQSLDVLLGHVATVPENRVHEPVPGFGFPTVWKQLIHLITCEEGWVCDLQAKPFAGWTKQEHATMGSLVASKRRVAEATLRYLDGLSEEQFNAPLAVKPQDWMGPLRSPAYIFLHFITHAFHHKGQVVAMLRILGHPAPDTDLQRE